MINLSPIGIVENIRTAVEDDNWGSLVSKIVLDEAFSEESLWGLEDFSHVEVIFYFHEVDEAKIVSTARHPRNNPDWPKVGIFAQRGKNRPNRLGLTTAKIIRCEGRTLYVENLDAIDGTPVLDLKPVMQEFLPAGTVRQPQWSHELMRAYWDTLD
jgi:tRNA-Thr(GGU) m(6)t(6)A37 methyltransferase TsaA